jgi:hypothetical protein
MTVAVSATPSPRRPSRRATPTWARIWSATVLLHGAGVLVAIWVARLVRAVPDSAEVETALRLGYYAAMLVVAIADALLVDELAFKGAFRRSAIEGRGAGAGRGKAPVRDEDVAALAASLQRGSAAFPFVVLLGFALTYQLFNWVNRDFDVYYRRVGKHVSALRGDDEAGLPRRLQAIAELSIRREPEILPVLFGQLMRGGDEAAWAAWAIGRHGDLKRRQRLIPPLVSLARGDDAALRTEALVALGRLQHRPIAPLIAGELQAALDRREPLDARLIYGLGTTQVMSSIPVLEAILTRGSVEEQRLAAWAIAQHRDQRGGERLAEVLHQRLPSAELPLRCALVHSLGILAHEASNVPLMRAYDGAPGAERHELCGLSEVFLRPDRLDDRIDLFVPRETYAMKTLQTMAQIRATAPEVRAAVEPWLAAVKDDPEATEATRAGAKALLEGIVAGRDDSTAPRTAP